MTWTGQGRIEWASIDPTPLDMVREHGGSLECPCGSAYARGLPPGSVMEPAITCRVCRMPVALWTWKPLGHEDVPGHWMAL